jgi:type II secretory ATPase GspE/PulE/Tfp pilus assembly ATPase PilB-like protein
MLNADWQRLNKVYYATDDKKLMAAAAPSDQTLTQARLLLGYLPDVQIVDATVLESLLATAGNGQNGGQDYEVVNEVFDGDEQVGEDLNIIEFVDGLISNAIHQKASDIHVEPGFGSVRVRYRVHGELQEAETYHLQKHVSVVARIKIMAALDIAESRRPLDGNIRVAAGGHQVDIRVSTMPTRFGEKVVMRLLDKNRIALDIDQLGFTQEQVASIQAALKHKNGIILCTGPTGSGKTTTLYSMLTALNNPSVNILTIEDPIEYELPGINQSQVNSAIGLTFAAALRSFLRQDPDIIMVGEIRDGETAEIALRAAMTGHLVLSTLHTNTPEGAKKRLVDMGGSEYLIEDTLRLVIGQELVPVVDNDRVVGREVKGTILSL